MLDTTLQGVGQHSGTPLRPSLPPPVLEVHRPPRDWFHTGAARNRMAGAHSLQTTRPTKAFNALKRDATALMR
eukprot:11742340-Alexandrium_andersonii.AAC.1